MATWKGNRPLEVLTLELQGEIFAIEATDVREILDPPAITAVPNSRPFVNGLINVRGKVAPLADLRQKFGMAPSGSTIDTRIVVLEVDVDGDRTTVGVLADKVYEVTEIAAAAIADTPSIGMSWRREYIDCIGKRGDEFIIVLDLQNIFAGISRKAELGGDLRSGRAAG